MYENDSPYSDIIAGRYEGLEPSTVPLITSTMPVRPDGAYGIAKAFGEAAGRYYSDRFGLSVVCLRIGSLNGSGRPEGCATSRRCSRTRTPFVCFRRA